MKLKEILSKNMTKICVIGLGYVGLPILVNLSRKFDCIGFDINFKRVKELSSGKDQFGEFSKKILKSKKIFFTNSKNKIRKYNFYIVAVPTPIFYNKKPDLSHLKDVCDMLSKILKANDIVIFESTVYPSVTNKYCIPLLEKKNKLKEGLDFFVGYSPERVNPGDNKHKLKNISKILAYPHRYDKRKVTNIYKNLGKEIIFSKNIREAEAAKVIENIQRDVNIGLINEIYLACKALNLNFENVINLAKTKWNFLKFDPGLVGGHCLPVDPYYFADICKKNRFKTKITLAGRSINDSMKYEILKNIESSVLKKKTNRNKNILICGLTYKKNVADLRNSLAFEIFEILKKRYKNIRGYDPLLSNETIIKNKLIPKNSNIKKFDIYILLTPHDLIIQKLKNLKNKNIIKILN